MPHKPEPLVDTTLKVVTITPPKPEKVVIAPP